MRSILRRVKEAEYVDRLIVHCIDHEIRKRSEHQFSRISDLPHAARVGKVLKRFGCIIQSLDCRGGKGRMVKIKIVGNRFEIVSSR